jgi:predicted esterase
MRGKLMSVRVNALLAIARQRTQVPGPAADRHPASSRLWRAERRRRGDEIFYTGFRKTIQTRIATSHVHPSGTVQNKVPTEFATCVGSPKGKRTTMGNTLHRKSARWAKAAPLQLTLATIICVAGLGVGSASASKPPTPATIGKAAQNLYVPTGCNETCQKDGTYTAMNWAAKKYGFPRWFIYATVHRESSFRPAAQNGSGDDDCAVGYGLTQLTCRAHQGVVYPENLSTPDQSDRRWQADMKIEEFCTQTDLCPYIDMRNVTALRTDEWKNPYKNLDRYLSGYAAPAFYLEKARAPQTPGESDTNFHNRILRRVAFYWRYGYNGPQYPKDPAEYLSGSKTYPYNWDTYVDTYRRAVEKEDGVWDGNVCRPPYSDAGCRPDYLPTTYDTNGFFHHTTALTDYYGYRPNNTYNDAVPINLFVWMHGKGGNAKGDMWKIAPAETRESQSYIAISLAGREGGSQGDHWEVNVDGPKLLAAVKDVQRYFNINPQKIYVGGYSSGGHMAYRHGLENAATFAGILVENSDPLHQGTVTGTTPEALMTSASWKIKIAHLAHKGDTAYPITTVRSHIGTLRANGFPVALIEKDGSHFDPDDPINKTGTDYDLKTELLPYLDKEDWVSP